MIDLLVFNFLAHIASGRNVRLLHSDVHVVPFHCLEHGVGLIARVSFELHIRVLFLESGCLLAPRSSGAHGGLEHALIILVLYDDALVAMTHLTLLCEDEGD